MERERKGKGERVYEKVREKRKDDRENRGGRLKV